MPKAPDLLPRTVYLLNPISGHGHLDSWARIFTAAFLELGHRVVLVTQQQTGLTSWLERSKSVNLERLHIINTYVERESEDEDLATAGENPEKPKPLFQRVAHRYRTEGLQGIASRIMTRLFKFHNYCSYNYWLNRYIRTDLNYLSPLSFTQAINNCISETRWTPDFIFILYLDLLSRNVYQWKTWEKELPFFWGGIQFHISNSLNHQKPLDPWFTRQYFRGSCFLTDAESSFHRKLFPGKVFATLPDVADPEQLPSPSPLMTQVSERSAGRTIVFIGGTLDGRKGLSTIVRVILQAPASEFFFLVVGRLYWEKYDTETAELLRSFLENLPENVFTYLDFVEDDREFTSLMGLSDIIYAVYHNFPYSSNMLIKAAHLERPLIVSDGYEMGRRVKEYGLGLAAPQDDVAAILKALSDLRQKKPLPANFASYKRDHSFEMLKSTLQEFLTDCMGSLG